MAATFATQSVNHVFVTKKGEALLSGGLLLEAFEVWIFDGNGFAAAFADHLAGLIPHGFIAGDAVALVDAAGDTGTVKVLDCPVDRRPADGFVNVFNAMEQLLRTDLTLVAHEYPENQEPLLRQPEIVLRKIALK